MSTRRRATSRSAEHNRTVARRVDRRVQRPRRRRRGRGPHRRLHRARARRASRPAALDSDAWVEFLGVFLEGFPDLHLEVLDSSADEGMVAQRILFTGTHTGSFRGLPPTGRKVRFSGLEINRMVDGKVAEHWFQLDAVTLFEQLGLRVVPGPRLLPRLLASPVTRLLGEAAAHGPVVRATFRVADLSRASFPRPGAGRPIQLESPLSASRSGSGARDRHRPARRAAASSMSVRGGPRRGSAALSGFMPPSAANPSRVARACAAHRDERDRASSPAPATCRRPRRCRRSRTRRRAVRGELAQRAPRAPSP